MGVKLGLLTLQQEHRLRVSENGVLRRIFEPKRNEIIEVGENCKVRNFATCILRQI
jgi:hypothetical protein